MDNLDYYTPAEVPVQGWLDCHSHQFEIPSLHPKPIEVDDKQYLPGVMDAAPPNQDWATEIYDEVGGEG